MQNECPITETTTLFSLRVTWCQQAKALRPAIKFHCNLLTVNWRPSPDSATRCDRVFTQSSSFVNIQNQLSASRNVSAVYVHGISKRLMFSQMDKGGDHIMLSLCLRKYPSIEFMRSIPL